MEDRAPNCLHLEVAIDKQIDDIMFTLQFFQLYQELPCISMSMLVQNFHPNLALHFRIDDLNSKDTILCCQGRLYLKSPVQLLCFPIITRS